MLAKIYLDTDHDQVIFLDCIDRLKMTRNENRYPIYRETCSAGEY